MTNKGRAGDRGRQGRGARPGLVGLLLCGLLCCTSGSTTADGPLVRLRLSPVDPLTVRADLNITALDSAGQPRQAMTLFASGPFELLAVAYPPGTRGATSYQVSLYKDPSCLAATGQAALTLDSDGVFDVAVTMTAVSLCGNAATVSVQLANLSGGVGSVTSTPAGISCASPGSGCAATFSKGTQLTLTADATSGAFAGWSGGTCTGLGRCTFTVTEDVQLQAVFTACHGWCKEPLPVPPTANLNGIAGTAANNIVVVGDAGTVLRWDGTAWATLAPPSGSGVALRAAFGRPGGTTVFTAGDGGTILQLSGTTWKSIPNTVTTAALRAIAIGLGSSPATYFVGDNGAALVLSGNGSSVSGRSSGTTAALLGLSENPSSGNKDDLYMVGSVVAGKGFAQSWDGSNGFTSQMVGPGDNIAGNIHTMLCGGAYHYAAGDGGKIIRRSSSSNNADKWMLAASPTTQTLRGLWSSADNNIYAVGDAGTILQFDGTTWRPMNSSSTVNLRAVWGSSATNIYAVGDSGTVLHFLP